MKYYCSKNEEGKYKAISSERNITKLLNDHNRIMVIDGGPLFHVFTYNDSICEEEKKVFLYPELINYLKGKDKNVYFLNSDKYRPSLIINDANNRRYCESLDYIPKIEYSIYTLKDDEILSLNASIDKNALQESLKELIVRMNDEDIEFKNIYLNELINNQELLELYNYPVANNFNYYLMPPYSYAHPSLFYILNGIYSHGGEEISLSEQNIKDLFIEKNSEYNDIVDKIIKSINVNIYKKYSLEEFSNSIDYIENVKESENDYTIDLEIAKKILLKAKQNEKVFNELGILNESKEKQLKKASN